MHIIDNSTEKTEKSVETVSVAYKPDGTVQHIKKPVLAEHDMQVFVNDRLAMKLVCTPEYLKELLVGRLITAGFIQETEDIEQLYICESGHTARVFLKKPWVEKTPEIIKEPTCCTGNRVFFDGADSERMPLAQPDFKPEWVFALTEAFAADSRLHKSTGGTHSAYLAVEGKVLFSAEDIGRHNALDKAVGYLYLNQIPPEACMLFTTGRVPADMAEKAIAARIPVLVSKAVPTTEGIALAKAYGLKLICKAWPDSFEVFA